MCIRYVGEHFTNYLCIGDLFLLIHRDVNVANNFKCVYPPGALVLWNIGSFSYALAQLYQFVGVRFIPYFFILGMFLYLSVFEGLYRFFIEYGHCPVEEKLAQTTVY